MSRTLTVSDELFANLEAEARARGLSVERLLEEWKLANAGSTDRKDVIQRIDELRESLFTKYGPMPDSTELLHQDRSR